MEDEKQNLLLPLNFIIDYDADFKDISHVPNKIIKCSLVRKRIIMFS